MSYRPTFGSWNTRMINQQKLAGAAATTNIDVVGLDSASIATDDIILYAEVEVPDNFVAQYRRNVLAGTTATTNIAVSGITTSDKVVECLLYTIGTGKITNITDVTSETSITSAGNIKLASTNSTGHKLVLRWIDVSSLPANKDITSQVSITSAGHIQVATDITTGYTIDLTWLDVSAVERPYG